jgi:small subunit ribosomal protein S13
MRISGITIPDNKRLKVGLTVLYGIGLSLSKSILIQAKVDPEKKPTEISPDEENAIRKIIEVRKIEGDLKREVSGNVKRLKDIKSYRGTRHAKEVTSSRTTNKDKLPNPSRKHKKDYGYR